MMKLNNSTKVVISQSMYFPWVGLLKQIKIADIFIHYNDVQLARGFANRIQIKTDQGTKWLTVPLKNRHRGQTIEETLIDNESNWKRKHIEFLKSAYFRAPYKKEMLQLEDQVLCQDLVKLSDMASESTMALAGYFGLEDRTTFLDSKNLRVLGSNSQRLLDLCKRVEAVQYVTGHGASNYLNHDIFE